MEVRYPPPLKRGISAILARYPMKTRQMGAIPPSAILSRKGIARYGGVSRTGPLRSDIERNISNVALMLQGEVFKILQDAVKKMTAKGFNVLIEGREQPLNRMGTKHRFELALPSVHWIA